MYSKLFLLPAQPSQPTSLLPLTPIPPIPSPPPFSLLCKMSCVMVSVLNFSLLCKTSCVMVSVLNFSLLCKMPYVMIKNLWKKIFLCFWTHCLELPTTIPQKNSALQLLKRNLTSIDLKFICAEVQVNFCVYHSGGVVYTCACVCLLCVSLSLSLCECAHTCLYTCVCTVARETVWVFD